MLCFFVFFFPTEDETDPRLINENLNDKNKRLKILEETFGTNQQPILETIEYKVRDYL